MPTPTLAASSLAFTWLPLEAALARLAALGFRFADVAAVPGWAHVEPAELQTASERRRVVAAARAAGVEIVALNAALEGTTGERAGQAQALAETALAVGASIVTLQPPNAGTPWQQVVSQLTPLQAIAAESRVRFSLEIHRDRVTEIPADAARLAQETGLGLTLDPSHIYAGPAQGAHAELVLPFVDHVHVRDARARPPDLQVPFGAGVVPFAELFAGLVAHGYDGALSVEYVGRSPSELVDADLVEAACSVTSLWPIRPAGGEAFRST